MKHRPLIPETQAQNQPPVLATTPAASTREQSQGQGHVNPALLENPSSSQQTESAQQTTEQPRSRSRSRPRHCGREMQFLDWGYWTGKPYYKCPICGKIQAMTRPRPGTGSTTKLSSSSDQQGEVKR